MKHAMVVVMLVALAGCGGGGFQKEFTDACLTSGRLEKPVCDCMAKKAQSDLTEDERQFVLAALKKDEAETTRLRGKLGLEGAMRAGMFMTNVAACAAPGTTRP